MVLVLVERLGSEDPAEREDASARLARLGPRAFRALERGLAHRDAEVRGRSLDLLARQLDALPSDLVARHESLGLARLVRDWERIRAKLGAVPHQARSRAELVGVEPYGQIASLGRAVVPLVLRDLDGPWRHGMILALGLFDDPRAAAALDELARSDEVYTTGG